jgi:hypothetical protein
MNFPFWILLIIAIPVISSLYFGKMKPWNELKPSDKKNITITTIIGIFLLVVFGYCFYPLTSNELNNPEESEQEEVYILQLMDKISDIMEIDSDPMPTEVLATNVKWNTENGEFAFNGIGYGFGDTMNSTNIINKYEYINSLLRQEGFTTDAYNAGSGYNMRYENDNIVCNLIRTDIEESDSTHIDIVCADTENSFIISNSSGLGGQRDQYGCLGSAGYSWDPDIFACIRSWEFTNDDQRTAARISTNAISWEKGTTILGVESNDCTGCFTVNIQKGEVRVKVIIENWLSTDIVDSD